MDLQCMVRRNPEIVHSDMDGEIVMMSINEGRYYGLNEVGSQIWEILEREVSVEAICKALLSRYNVEEAQCRNEVLAFLGELAGNKVIEIS